MHGTISFRTGVWWFVQGWQIFKRQPLNLLLLFAYYSAAMFLLALVPYFGQIVNIVVLPLFSVMFMNACKKIEQGQPLVLQEILKISAIPRYRTLLKQGGLYLLFLLLALLPGLYFYGESFSQLLLLMAQNTEANVSSLSLEHLLGGMILMSVCLIPVFMAFWFAPNLVSWQGMSLFKSLFFSLMIWRQHLLAWLGYISVFALLSMVVPMGLVFVLGTIAPQLIALFVVPYLLWVSVLLYCSLYPCYQSFFAE